MIKRIGFLIFNDIQQLDMTGPYEVFASLPDIEIELIAKSMDRIQSVTRLPLFPTTTFDRCGKLDILCILGGRGINQVMLDTSTIEFIKEKAQETQYITSICTGALALGIAGLLKNKHATTHWSALDLIPLFGAIASRDRVVFDGKLITAGGVTAGIDFALTLIARLFGEDMAKRIQLNLQYAPLPPFQCGTPDEAPPHIYNLLLSQSAIILEQRLKIIEKWKAKDH